VWLPCPSLRWIINGNDRRSISSCLGRRSIRRAIIGDDHFDTLTERGSDRRNGFADLSLFITSWNDDRHRIETD
jgi:hypothetical protein